MFAASPGAKLTKWHIEDWWIASLAASKKLTASEPCLKAANMQKELEWRKLLQAQVGQPIDSKSTTQLATSIIFTIEPSRMKSTDLDNFCVPALTGLKAIGLSARNVVELHAIKQAADENTGISTQMRVWALPA